jgi:hypothetical protein
MQSTEPWEACHDSGDRTAPFFWGDDTPAAKTLARNAAKMGLGASQVA